MIEFILDMPENPVTFEFIVPSPRASFEFIIPNVIIQLEDKMYQKINFTGEVDGVNTIFVAEHEVEDVFKNGLILQEGPDYILSEDLLTVTFNEVPFFDPDDSSNNAVIQMRGNY